MADLARIPGVVFGTLGIGSLTSAWVQGLVSAKPPESLIPADSGPRLNGTSEHGKPFRSRLPYGLPAVGACPDARAPGPGGGRFPWNWMGRGHGSREAGDTDSIRVTKAMCLGVPYGIPNLIDYLGFNSFTEKAS